MAKYINPAKVVTGVCRFSYANLWEAKAMDENSKPKYSVSLIIPKSDTKTIEKIRAAIQAAYEEGQGKLKGNSKSVPPLTSIKTPLRDGDLETFLDTIQLRYMYYPLSRRHIKRAANLKRSAQE